MDPRDYVTRWLIILAGAAVLLVWGLITIYLDKRDRRRQQGRTQ